MKLFIIAISFAALLCGQGQWFAPPPPPVQFVTAGPASPGTSNLCYWVVAIYPIGKSAPSSSCLENVSIGSGRSITVTWVNMPSAIAYDVLVTTSKFFPPSAICPGCLIKLNATSGPIIDTGATRLDYTVSRAPAASATETFNNIDFSQPIIQYSVPVQWLGVSTNINGVPFIPNVLGPPTTDPTFQYNVATRTLSAPNLSATDGSLMAGAGVGSIHMQDVNGNDFVISPPVAGTNSILLNLPPVPATITTGVPAVAMADVATGSSGASITATTIITTNSGSQSFYRLCAEVLTTSAGSGNVTVTITWTDSIGAKTQNIFTSFLLTVNNVNSTCIVFLASNATTIKYATTYASTGQYNLRLFVEPTL